MRLPFTLAIVLACAGCGSSDAPKAVAPPPPPPPERIATPEPECGPDQRDRAVQFAVRAAGRAVPAELDFDHPSAEYKTTPAPQNAPATEAAAAANPVWVVRFPRRALGAKEAPTGATLPPGDVQVHDLRAELGVSPGPRSTDEDFTPGSGSGGRPSGSTTWKSKSAPTADLWVGWAYADIHDQGFVGVFGLDVAHGVHSPRGLGGGSLQYETLMPQVRAGWAWAPSTDFHLEFTPFIGFGAAHVQWADNGNKDSGWGTGLTYGVMVAGWARLGEGWSLGGNAGYQGGVTTATVDNGSTGGSSDLTMHTSGFVAHVGAGYQF
jgi:hypothetical protein